VLKSTWVIPELGALVGAVLSIRRTSTANEDDSDDHEDNCGRELEQCSPELFLGITKSTENIDEDDHSKEYL
jgi:hypothetical protein